MKSGMMAMVRQANEASMEYRNKNAPTNRMHTAIMEGAVSVDGIHHVGDISLQPIQKVSAVSSVPVFPLAVEQTVEIEPLHVVLCLDSQKWP